MYHLYILQSGRDGSYYIGHTKDLDERITRHNLGHSLSTKAKIPWKLVYQEGYPTKSEAQKREYALKRKKSKNYIEFLIRGVAQSGLARPESVRGGPPPIKKRIWVQHIPKALGKLDAYQQ